MADKKSQMPDMKEIGEMAGKFFGDVKKSVCEIIEGYKSKRDDDATTTEEPSEDNDAPSSDNDENSTK